MEEYLQIALKALTIEQWKAWIFLVVITSALTETAKRTFFLTMTKTRKKQWIWGSSFVFGYASAYVGFLMVGTKWTPDYYWAMFGVTAGPISNMLHYVTLRVIAWKAPELAETIKGRI